MAVSRELSGDDKISFQRNRSRNYLSEANYVEFSGVKVAGPLIHVTGNPFPKCCVLTVTLMHFRLLLRREMFWWRISPFELSKGLIF